MIKKINKNFSLLQFAKSEKKMVHKRSCSCRRVVKGGRGGGGGLPPARLKQVQFALNRKLFWCYALNYRPEEFSVSSFLCRKTVPQHNF